MSRVLEVQLEPSDAFGALLRAIAAAEASRWPPELSGRMRLALELEFRHLEEAVRTLGVCYADLDERGLATLDRRGLSRFADVNNVLHLVALPISVSADLDAFRMAIERGDQPLRVKATKLATTVRTLLWYGANSDLLVCPRVAVAGNELPPDRALKFVDALLGAAWRPDGPPTPPDPRKVSQLELVPERETVTPEVPLPLVNPIGAASQGESTAIMRSPLVPPPFADGHTLSDLAPIRPFNDLTSPALGPEARRATDMGRDSTAPIVSPLRDR